MTTPGRAVTGLAVRQVRRSLLLVTIVVAGLSAVVAVQYRTTIAESGGAASLEALAGNPAIRTLFGTPVALDDPGGFTVWRTGTPMAVLVGVWALLVATRVTRGEEDAGRWAVLLTGVLRVRAVLVRYLAVLLTGQVLVGAALAGALVAAGTDATGAVLYGATAAGVGASFVAVGLAAAQLFADRRAAAGAAAGVLGVLLILRMVADGAPRLAWLMWGTPFGLLAQAQPYAANRLAPLLVLAAGAAALCVAALAAAGSRDVGAGRLPVRSSRPPRLRLLRSVPRFAVRRTLRSATGWAAALAAYFLLIGVLADSLTQFLADNPRFAELAAAAGFADLARVEGYVASLFGLLAVPVGVFAATRIGADAADETAGRFTLLFASPVSRARWALTHAVTVAGACGVLAVVAGVAMWAGTRVVGAGLGLGQAVAGAANTLPVALVCLGAAVLALGWAPHAVLPVGAVPAVGGFLLQVLAQSFSWPQGVAQLSPFSHISRVPAAPPDWTGAAGLVIVAGLLGAAGVARYHRRDTLG